MLFCVVILNLWTQVDVPWVEEGNLVRMGRELTEPKLDFQSWVRWWPRLLFSKMFSSSSKPELGKHGSR